MLFCYSFVLYVVRRERPHVVRVAYKVAYLVTEKRDDGLEEAGGKELIGVVRGNIARWTISDGR